MSAPIVSASLLLKLYSEQEENKRSFEDHEISYQPTHQPLIPARL